MDMYTFVCQFAQSCQSRRYIVLWFVYKVHVKLVCSMGKWILEHLLTFHVFTTFICMPLCAMIHSISPTDQVALRGEGLEPSSRVFFTQSSLRISNEHSETSAPSANFRGLMDPVSVYREIFLFLCGEWYGFSLCEHKQCPLLRSLTYIVGTCTSFITGTLHTTAMISMHG